MLRVYVDMDYILYDFDTAYRRSKSNFSEIAYSHSQPDFFVGLKPLSSALATFNWLNDKEHFDLSVLTAPSVWNPQPFTEKRLWIEKYLGLDMAYKLMLSPNKSLLKGGFLIVDRDKGKGQDFFEGKLLHFRNSDYSDRASIKFYIRENYA